jgi:hypothetical protein
MNMEDTVLGNIQQQRDADPAPPSVRVPDDNSMADTATQPCSHIDERLPHRWHPPTIGY